MLLAYMWRPRAHFFKALILVIPVIWLLAFTIFALLGKHHGIEGVKKTWYNRMYDLVANGKKPTADDNQIHLQVVQTNETANLRNSSSPDDPGEMGKEYILPDGLSSEIQKQVDLGWERHALNQYLSDVISVHRSLPDVRHKGCLNETYSDDLPKTSIIICFYNEAWSVLLRTIHSVLDRSPAHLIEEIILIDDYSNMVHLKNQLDDYVKSLEKVRVIHTKKREGLARCRNIGVSVAKGPVLTFLDSHCECTQGWLEPLLQRIYYNRTTVVSPAIDYIDSGTFSYTNTVSEKIFVGGFDWNLKFFSFGNETRTEMLTHPWDPIRSPVINGASFAIDKNFLEHLGAFDDGFEISGGENLELSFKTWMCGGTLEIVPCSHVGHVTTLKAPAGYWPPDANVNKNNWRIAEVWLDEYKWFYYINHEGDSGDTESRKELRKRLNCKSFDWYLENVYSERTIPTKDFLAFGKIRNLALEGNRCISYTKTSSPGLSACDELGFDQDWKLTNTGEIKHKNYCLDYTSAGSIIMYPCVGRKGNQEWVYNTLTYSIRNPLHNKCLEMSEDKTRLLMDDCSGKYLQHWKFQFVTFTSSNATNTIDVSS